MARGNFFDKYPRLGFPPSLKITVILNRGFSVISMARAMKFLVVVISMFWVLSMQHSSVHGKPEVPCFFIFGDSLADSGNNNVLNTTAQVNYQPYGIDFPYGPTGRFCNGRTTIDIISMHLKYFFAGITCH